MRPSVLVPCGALLMLALPASATEVGTLRTFGLGVQIGEPTGLVGKAFVGRGNAIDFGVGFLGWGWRGRCQAPDGHWYDCRDRRGYLSVHVDYLWQESFFAEPFRLDWHAGAGARVLDWRDSSYHDAAVLARVPLGLDFAFRRPSWLEAYVEVAPGLMILPGPDLWFDVGLGARAFF
jgi:hypothetical protein